MMIMAGGLPETNRKPVIAWVLFDFANSAYTTLVVTFIYSAYFVKAIAANEIMGTALWSRGVTLTAISVAVLSPALGAVADRSGLRKSFLFFATSISVTGTAMLYFVAPGQVFLALLWFVISNIAFELANVFYNAFLPEIAPKDKIGRISGIGWGVGYIGGLIAMFIAMAAFVSPETPWFGLSRDTGANIRATNLLVAVWFAIFSIPIFLYVKSNPSSAAGNGKVKKPVKEAFRDLLKTFQEIKKYKEIIKLLIARMVYNDGLVTIFAFGGIYAAGEFGFSFDEIMIFGIVLNVAAGFGALIMGHFDDKLGGKKTVQISNIVLTMAVILAVIAPDKGLFWVAGILIGLFAGPNQSASRSLLGRFVPRTKENQFFGFFAFSGKMTAFLGPFLLGVVTELFDSQRAGVLVVALFFIAGGLLLTRVDEAKGVSAGSSS